MHGSQQREKKGGVRGVTTEKDDMGYRPAATMREKHELQRLMQSQQLGEREINDLEREYGYDMDGDGDVGMRNGLRGSGEAGGQQGAAMEGGSDDEDEGREHNTTSKRR